MTEQLKMIIGIYKGYKIYGQNSLDYKNKCLQIDRGETRGFFLSSSPSER